MFLRVSLISYCCMKQTHVTFVMRYLLCCFESEKNTDLKKLEKPVHITVDEKKVNRQLNTKFSRTVKNNFI